MNEYHLISSFDHLAAKGESNGGLPATKNLIGERSHTWLIKNNIINSGLQCFGEFVYSTNHNSALAIYYNRLESIAKSPMVYRIKACATSDRRFKYHFSATIKNNSVFNKELIVDRPLNLPSFYQIYWRFMNEGQESVPQAFDNSPAALTLLPFEAISHNDLFEIRLQSSTLVNINTSKHMWFD